MNLLSLWFHLLLISMVLLLIAPAAESTFLLFACIFRLSICPFRTTTVASSG
ncbi:uncharacterized protein LOC132793188 [Drosophila nasuta]|uniref:Uncharacterized protein LOC117566780 n=1 Tax=Drosophila albomicans TaxID=7291 RepID=A0A6P8WFS4_DROAB|nr:uncharacterized protein LOC117566780 [Drosophila albomicans]XP_060658872.1 uncharacterized protein LOC132793188 [Drosophila nasuta]